MNSPEGKSDGPESRRPPLWLRVLLMAALIAAAALAFYVNNLRVIEQLQDR